MGFYLSLIICVVSRLVPHVANFTPLGSLILLNSRKSSLKKGIALAILAMVITDIFLGFNFSSVFVYAGFLTYAFWGQIKKLSPVLGVLLGSVSFFLISNFGVWVGPWYPHNVQGLISCFVNAIPFYRNTVLSDLGFVIVFIALGYGYKVLKNKYQFKEELIWVKNLKLAISNKR